jgi:type II secretory pathway component GspD/PulD (secretin)
MNRTLCAALLCLLVLTCSAPALAQDATAKRVTLDLNGVTPAAALKAVSDAIGVTANVDAAVTDPVDITVRNVSARTALNAICESIGCRWTLTGNTLVVKPLTASMAGRVKYDVRVAVLDKGKASARTQVLLNALKQKLPADMKFENAALDEVSKHLTEALKMPVEIRCKDASVETLTVDLGDLTLQEALKTIVEQEVRAKAAWWLKIGPLPGETQTSSIAIMIGPKTVKKTATKR